MGNGASRVVGCFMRDRGGDGDIDENSGVAFSSSLDEGLGHSFCYVRAPDSPPPPPTSLTPCASARYNLGPGITPLAAEDSRNGSFRSGAEDESKLLFFKAISGTSVSANTFTPRTIVAPDQFGANTFLSNSNSDRAAAFDSTPSFVALPLQRLPRCIPPSSFHHDNKGFASGPLERVSTMSGPLERGFLSGPLERGSMSGPIDPADRIHFSAPLAGTTYNMAAALRRQRRSLTHLMRTVGKPVKKAISRTLGRTQKSLVTPVKHLVWRPARKESGAKPSCSTPPTSVDASIELHPKGGLLPNLHWYQGIAGEDRVHVVLSEEHEWLFVGIYDGFNGPDATDFLMSNLYQSIFKELQGLLWDTQEEEVVSDGDDRNPPENPPIIHEDGCKSTRIELEEEESNNQASKLVDTTTTSKASDNEESMTNLDFEEKAGDSNGSSSLQKDCCLVDEQEASQEAVQHEILSTLLCQPDDDIIPCVSDVNRNENLHRPFQWKAWGGKHLFRSRQPTRAHGEKKEENHAKMLAWECDWEQQHKKATTGDKRQEEKVEKLREFKRGVAEPEAVLKALADALEATEEAYLEMADQALEENPELALMGSCVLVMLMKGEDVYVMNVGDSRVILAQELNETWNPAGPSNDSSLFDTNRIGGRDLLIRPELERIVEETPTELEDVEAPALSNSRCGLLSTSIQLNAVQLSTDHCTSIQDEVLRIQAEHPDDALPIFNDRVKGRLKVTRAFGAGFLKKPKWNCTLLEMFRVEYVGTSPYISCKPALCHHRVGPRDRFLVISSDGLYQFLSNEDVVSHVEWFMENFPEGDPAQHLVEQLLFRAAKKAGMDFHDLLEIPQGDRRKYHDDVSVMVISLNGKIWRSSS